MLAMIVALSLGPNISHSFTCRIVPPVVIFYPVFLCGLLIYSEDVSRRFF
jgi:hypothetical protein